MILAPNGRPVSSTRKVTLQIKITDTKPGATDSELRTLSFVLDVPDRRLVGQLLDEIKRGVLMQLDAVHFFDQGAPIEPGAGGRVDVASS